MDALDEAFSSWMRDIRLGKARLLVPQSFTDNIGRGKGAVFEPEREVFVPVAGLLTGEGPVQQSIMAQQFNIRWQEHKGTCDAILEQVINMAGYAGQTFGLQGDIAVTATEVTARERKSLTTRGKKITYWRPALADIIYGLMSISASVFGEGIEPVRPEVEWPDAVLPNALELAQTVSAMRQAEGASIETAVAELHPDWTPEKVAEEVSRIYAEQNVDMLARARVTISGGDGETLQEQLASIPGAIGATDIASQVEEAANSAIDNTGAEEGQ